MIRGLWMSPPQASRTTPGSLGVQFARNQILPATLKTMLAGEAI